MHYFHPADGEHEVVFTCRGDPVAATPNGKALQVQQQEAIRPRGRLQWNAKGGQFRLLSLDYRPLP